MISNIFQFTEFATGLRGLSGLMGRMNLQGSGGRPSNLRKTTKGLLLIPPVAYNIPELSRRGVNFELLLPSGVTDTMVRLSIEDQGWTVVVKLTWLDFFAQGDRVNRQDNLTIGHSEANAMQEDVELLRDTNIDDITTTWIIASPIQLEQRIDPANVQVFATPNSSIPGQFTFYLKARLRTEPLGYRWAAAPQGVRYVNVSQNQQPGQQPFSPFSQQQPF